VYSQYLGALVWRVLVCNYYCFEFECEQKGFKEFTAKLLLRWSNKYLPKKNMHWSPWVSWKEAPRAELQNGERFSFQKLLPLIFFLHINSLETIFRTLYSYQSPYHLVNMVILP